MSHPRIVAIATAVPPFSLSQRETEAVILGRFGGDLSGKGTQTVRAAFGHPSVERRHFAFDRPERVIDEDPDARIARFTEWAVRLSSEAAGRALERAGVVPGDVTGIAVNTCTGYVCPGLSTYVMERLGLRRDIPAYDFVGSGCGGAIPNLQVCSSLAAGDPVGVVLSVSVEICSAAFQMGDDPGLIVSNAIFGDGASAALIAGGSRGPAVVGSRSRFEPEQREHIRFVHRNGQLRNQLSPRVPRLAARAAGIVVRDLLSSRGLAPRDVRHWAIHPGGQRVIDEVREELGLTEEHVMPARDVLRDFGNMSSPGVWFVLRRMLESVPPAPGDPCVMLAFGAGLSAHAALLTAGEDPAAL